MEQTAAKAESTYAARAHRRLMWLIVMLVFRRGGVFDVIIAEFVSLDTVSFVKLVVLPSPSCLVMVCFGT